MGSKRETTCPECGATVREWRNPIPTVDIIIEIEGRIVLIERANEPFGWALPGGFVDYGESLETAAAREAKEETGLEVADLAQFKAYSDPARDVRQHNISVVFTATAQGKPKGGDDARRAELFDPTDLPELAFDHAQIVADWLESRSPE